MNADTNKVKEDFKKKLSENMIEWHKSELKTTE